MSITTLTDSWWRRRPGFDDLCRLLDAEDDGIRLVGGAVRDSLLGITVADIDLATRLLPEEVMRRLGAADIKVIPTGIDHGTITAVLDHHPIEITTLRRDVSTDGRRATIAFTQDWKEDAARRDFTINALYANPLTGEVHDYFGGLEDLAARKVRFIGDAGERIAEDHLRILRYFRFLARFGALPPDEAAYAACVDHANSLMALSRERIADEVMKLLALPDPSAVLALMIDGGIFLPVIPEVDQEGLQRLHSLIEREAAANVPASAALRLAALLPADPEIGARVAARLKLSNKLRKRITAALTPPPPYSHMRELAFRVGEENAIDHLLLKQDASVDDIKALISWEIPQFPLSGGHLIAMGMDPGPQIARALGAIRDEWIAAGFPPADEAQAIALRYVTGLDRSSQKSKA